jgi:hypothetical protein
MTFTVGGWLLVFLVVVVVLGLSVVAWVLVSLPGWVLEAWRWWRRDRIMAVLTCRQCEEGEHERCERYRDMPGPAWCVCDDESHAELPPERSWEEITGPHLTPPAYGADRLPHVGAVIPAGEERQHLAALVADYERREPAWQAECRLAYAALGFDDPTLIRGLR